MSNTSINTKVNNQFGCLDILEEESYKNNGIKIVPANGAHVVTLMENERYNPAGEGTEKYIFKADFFAPRKNQSRPVKDRDGNVKGYELWDETQEPDAIIRPKAIKLYFREESGNFFSAYLPCYVMRDGNTVWNKFVDDMAEQTEEVGMNIIQTLNYLTKKQFKVWVYENPKFKEKQVCYTENDYNYWVGVQLERERKEAAYQEKKARQKKIAKEIDESVELSKKSK